MNATSPGSTSPAPRTLDVSGTPDIPFGRLVRVEIRKMLDTRGGFWLLMITGLLMLLAVGLTLAVVALADDAAIGANGWSTVLTIPLSLLLPVFAITVVTSEWSARTGLVTFSLEPRRTRVLLAKLSATIALAVGTIVLAVGLGAGANLVSGAITGETEWNLGLRSLVVLTVVQLLYFLMAFGLAMLVLNTPAAIAIFYVVALLLPLMVYSALYAFFEWAQSLIPWIDLQFATTPFFETFDDVGLVDVARLGTAILLWIVLPFVVGTRRVLTSEPK